MCRDLVREKSVSGEEQKVAERMGAALRQLGFDEIFIDGYGSIAGKIQGKRAGRTILFDGHMDTVPVADLAAWHYDPYAAECSDGKIYGRGTSDMKGALSAMISAAGFFAEDCRKDFAGNIYVAGVVHEECFEGIASRQISRRVNPDVVIIGEASELNLKCGQRGRAELVLETFGRPAHSANPGAGLNAVYKMTGIIQRIQELAVAQHPVLGQAILELTDIKSSPYPGASVVPAYCRATYDRRLLVGESPAAVLQPITDLLFAMRQADPELEARVSFAAGSAPCYTGERIAGERFFPGWLYDEADEFVQTVLAGLREAGLKPAITQYSFCTNGSHYAGEAGIKTVGFGPSRENLAHTNDEYIEIEELLQATEGYYGILKALTGRLGCERCEV